MLTSLFKSLQEYICMLIYGLKPYPILLFGEILLRERSSVVFLLSASNKSLLPPKFGLDVSFGSVPTKRWTQFSGNRRNATMSCVMHACQSCPILWDLIDYSPPGSSVHGILQAGILEWVVISFSRGSSQPSDRTHISWVSCIGRQILYYYATWEALLSNIVVIFAWQY